MTSWSERGAPSASRAAGFTLIELLTVLTVLGLMAGLVLNYAPHRSRTLDLKAAAGELAADLRLARARAISGNQPVELVVDVADHRYAIGDGQPRAVPPDLSIELLTIGGQRAGATRGGIRFNADGSSTGGRVSLGDGHRRVAVGVDWLTGRVTVADVR